MKRNTIDPGKLAARLLWHTLSWYILTTPDLKIADRIGRLRWLVWVITGDRFIRSVLTEVVEIFQDGPPGTDVVRKMMLEAHPDFASDTVRGALGI